LYGYYALGGNAGLATAYAGQRLGVPTTVVVPETTPEFIRERLRSYGAAVEVHGSQWSEANERAVALCESVGGKLVHPFEDVDTWTGHATVRNPTPKRKLFREKPE
jgi:L-serine/L-threonine ammonia-lyase